MQEKRHRLPREIKDRNWETCVAQPGWKRSKLTGGTILLYGGTAQKSNNTAARWPTIGLGTTPKHVPPLRWAQPSANFFDASCLICSFYLRGGARWCEAGPPMIPCWYPAASTTRSSSGDCQQTTPAPPSSSTLPRFLSNTPALSRCGYSTCTHAFQALDETNDGATRWLPPHWSVGFPMSQKGRNLAALGGMS